MGPYHRFKQSWMLQWLSLGNAPDWSKGKSFLYHGTIVMELSSFCHNRALSCLNTFVSHCFLTLMIWVLSVCSFIIVLNFSFYILQISGILYFVHCLGLLVAKGKVGVYSCPLISNPRSLTDVRIRGGGTECFWTWPDGTLVVPGGVPRYSEVARDLLGLQKAFQSLMFHPLQQSVSKSVCGWESHP